MPAHLRKRIDKAYAALGSATPLAGDCGEICGAACCKGDGETGMLLFPGEAARLAKVPGYRIHRIDYMKRKCWLLVCDETCDRSLRPLACRIFPLAPSVDAHGRIKAVPDPRARLLCPLADGRSLNQGFYKAVSRAMNLLAEDEKMLDLMHAISEEIDEINSLYDLLLGDRE